MINWSISANNTAAQTHHYRKVLLSPYISLSQISEEEKIALITFELNQRGLKIGKRELNYIFNYHSRDLDSLLKLANQLDKVSLEQIEGFSTVF